MKWLKERWWAIWRLTLAGLIALTLLGGCGYWVWTAPKGCHIVYVQTTPVDGQPAMERRDVCDAPH